MPSDGAAGVLPLAQIQVVKAAESHAAGAAARTRPTFLPPAVATADGKCRDCPPHQGFYKQLVLATVASEQAADADAVRAMVQVRPLLSACSAAQGRRAW